MASKSNNQRELDFQAGSLQTISYDNNDHFLYYYYKAILMYFYLGFG